MIMSIDLYKVLLGKNKALFIISLLLISSVLIIQESDAQESLCVGGSSNGQLEGGEECDDGNEADADGCTGCRLDCEITVEKDAIPADNTPFSFLRLTLPLLRLPVFNEFTLTDPGSNESTFFVPFLSGTFIGEIPPQGWELNGVTCDSPAVLDLSQPPAEIPEEFQEDFEKVRSSNLIFAVCILSGSARCTYTNTQIVEPTCNITVGLDAPEGDDTEFDFNLLSEGLDENFDLSNGQIIPFNDLPLGTVITITEFVPDRWSLDSIVCDGDASFNDTVNGNSVDLTCNSSGEVNCTFVNSRVLILNTPTLSEWGLMAMAAVLGIAGFIVMRRRRLTA
jgi:hypothetical protein